MTEKVQPYNKFKSRKYILALVSITFNSILVGFGLISDGVYSAVVIATIGGYYTANVTQTGISK